MERIAERDGGEDAKTGSPLTAAQVKTQSLAPYAMARAYIW